MVKLSIVFTVYNQIDILRDSLKRVLVYPYDDVEIIISDDRSPEDIESMIRELKDPRIQYCRNESNLGHDKNILAGLRRCHSPYAMVMRSRDTVMGEKIGTIIAAIEKNPSAGLFMFSSNDGDGNIRIRLGDQCYTAPQKTTEMNARLYAHPSGTIWNLTYLDLDKIQLYLDKHFPDSRYGFVAHLLIRTALAEKAAFLTSSEVTWIYVITQKCKDTAVNSAPQNISVYAPSYQWPRLKCTIDFIANEITDQRTKAICNEIKRYYTSIVFDFRNINNNELLNRHYSAKPIQYSPKEQRKLFKEYIKSLLVSYPDLPKSIVLLPAAIDLQLTVKNFIKRLIYTPALKSLYQKIKVCLHIPCIYD